MSHGSLGTRGREASLSIALCLIFPSWLAEVAFPGGVSQVAHTAPGRHFPGTPGMPPWDRERQHQLGMFQPAQKSAVCPGGSPFPEGHQLCPLPIRGLCRWPRHSAAGQSWGGNNCIALRPAASLARGGTLAMPWGYRVTSPWSLSPHGIHSPAPPVLMLRLVQPSPVTGGTAPNGNSSAGIETLFLPAPRGRGR